MSQTLKCEECGHRAEAYLGNHLAEAHGISLEEYTRRHPNAPAVTQAVLDLYTKRNSGRITRGHPPRPDQLTVNLMGIPFSVHHQVPASACLPLPPEFRFPEDRESELYEDFKLALIAAKRSRSMFVWGLPGSSKDSFFHAVSAKTRRPGIKLSIKPGADIQSWFFTRSIDKEGTGWEEGVLLKALRDGYEVKDAEGNVIERIPYLIVISDFDRADRAQAEHLRLILDTIEGLVEGPGGQMFRVLPGTTMAATANTAGGGDPRARMTSSNVIDGSIMDRWDRVYQFHWMSWKDEGEICKAKFPDLVARAPGILDLMGKITTNLRQAIKGEEIYAEFSHRAVCQILGQAADLVLESTHEGTIRAAGLLTRALRCWLDRMPDPETRNAAESRISPLLQGGMRKDGRQKTAKGTFEQNL